MKKNKWIKRWNSWIAPTPSATGVWRRKEGGYLVRGRAKDPRTGKLIEIRAIRDDNNLLAAQQYLQDEKARIHAGITRENPQTITFREYSLSLLERKIVERDLKSEASVQLWRTVLINHLEPVFGNLLMDKFPRTEILKWKIDVAKMINIGEVKPATSNGWFSILKVVVNTYVADNELDRNPIARIKKFDESEYNPYPDEEPNSLTPDEVPTFIKLMCERHPQHFAMVALGFATGLRPSSMRPLRRKGSTPDVLWDENTILVRRSQTYGDAVMNTTKNYVRQRLLLPDELMSVLRWHVDHLEGNQKSSDLLFPSDTGGFRSRSCLDKSFADVARTMNLDKRITPRGMRRTFNDLARQAHVEDKVTRAISGHLTETMQRHYSTINESEVQKGIAEIISLVKVREAMNESPKTDFNEIKVASGEPH